MEVSEQRIPTDGPLNNKIRKISPLLSPYLHTLPEEETAAVSLRLGLN